MDYVHSKQIIHRDIKPDNIILRYRDSLPVLIDFGAVRETMGTVVNSQGNPTSSIVIGTPGYMPSEQAMGRPIYSSDLYSLGITAIYLLTGCQPQELETDSRTGEILWHAKALNVSPTLKAILDKAIAYHPRERFTTAKEMLDALLKGFVASTFGNGSAQASTVISQSKTTIVDVSKNQGLGYRGIILGSLITGGLIGGSVITGTIIARFSQPVAQQSTTNQTNAAKEISTPSSSPQPIEVPKTQVSPAPNTVTSVTSQPSPETEILNYYNDINSRRYQSAWDRLPTELQENKNVHPNGYASFASWWKTVESVDVRQTSITEKNGNTAKVYTDLGYNMKLKSS